MIHEYALDPAVLTTWEKVRYLIEKFGCEHGRMISRFPGKWKRMVWAGCSECAPVELKKIEECLSNIDSKLLRNGRSYDIELPWLHNAEIQHRTSPFHAIISDANPNKRDFVLVADDLSDRVPLWNVRRGVTVPRTSAEIMKCVRPLLHASTEVLFVDQHFDPSKIEYRNTLFAFAEILRSSDKTRRIEYHIGDKLGRPTFEKDCKDKLPTELPKGMKITFIRWEQVEGKETMHPRYILTDIGGISVEHGLDEGNDGETTDITLLDSALYEQRWRDYQRDTSPFKLLDEIEISGQRV